MKVNDAKWKKLRATLDKLGKDKAHVKVGVLSNEAHEGDGIGLQDLYFIHEFGSADGHIPERSSLRRTFRERASEFSNIASKLATGVINGSLEPKQALGQLGLWGSNAVKNTITSQDIPPPLKPSTIARKGSSKPLIDTSQLINAITFEVVS